MTHNVAARLLAAMQNIDADASVKLGEARIRLAININTLKPLVDAHQHAQTRLRAELIGDKFTPEKQFKAEALLSAEGEKPMPVNVKLLKLKVDDLRLGENQTITSDQIAGLAPILRDFANAAKWGPEDDDPPDAEAAAAPAPGSAAA